MASLLEFPDLRERALAWPDRARQAVVTDAETYRSAAELLLGIKDLRKELDAAYDEIIADAFKAHRTAVATKRERETPLAEAERIIKDALSTYDREQERLRREEETRQLDAARRAEEDRRLAEAAALEIEGRSFGDAGSALVTQAEQLLEETIQAPPVPVVPIIAKATPKVAGIAHTTTYSATVTSLLDLVKYVAAHPQHLNLVAANMTALNGLARSLKTGLQIPGVRVVETRHVSAGGRVAR